MVLIKYYKNAENNWIKLYILISMIKFVDLFFSMTKEILNFDNINKAIFKSIFS